MSLQSFQSALAYVIRSYEAEKSIDKLAHTYELTAEEKFTLQNLINQIRLKAYSEELFLSRWTIIREALKFLEPVVNLRAMSDLWEKEFEPKSNHIVHEDLALKFVQFLTSDQVGHNFIITNAPPFMSSLMEYVQAVFTFRHNVLPKIPLSKHGLLTGRYFSVVTLAYDVRELFSRLAEGESFDEPPLKDINLLFVADDEVTEFRSFEIDQELKNFLDAQLKGEHAPLPTCYDDLVAIGLCGSRKKAACFCQVH